ncbi:MAG: PDZ domain-containing protein [Lentisphaeria bacterium]|nr:PDZ domain-containing protein [Lentisphaeria bacterium]
MERAVWAVWVVWAMCLAGWSVPLRSEDAAAAGQAPVPAQRMVAYLGIGMAPVPVAEGAALGLPEGMGLTVTGVEEKSPAMHRIQVGDVLVQLDDQLIVNAHQLAVLVRSYAPGSEVRVGLLRGGNRMDVPVVLGEREATPLPLPGWPGMGGFPATRLQLPMHIQTTQVTKDGAVITINMGGDAGAQGAAAGQAGTAATVITVDGGRVETQTATATENGMQYNLARINGKTTYTVLSTRGEVLFNGPVDTAEEKTAVPEAYRAKLAELEERTRPPEDRPDPAAAPAREAP